MATTLLKRTLCEDPSDYESLLANLSIIRNLLDCDENGHVIDGPGPEILEKLFGPGGIWFNPGDPGDPGDPDDPNIVKNCDKPVLSCFRNICIYYNLKDCGTACCLWTVMCTLCIDEGLHAAGCPTCVDGDDLDFKETAECLACFLGCIHGDIEGGLSVFLDDALPALDALCDIVKQKATLKRTLNKAALTITECDF